MDSTSDRRTGTGRTVAGRISRSLMAINRHQVRLMAPKFVAPHRKSNKNDVNDSEVICEAVGRPTMRFVPIKTPEQQAVLTAS
jgi:transposase